MVFLGPKLPLDPLTQLNSHFVSLNVLVSTYQEGYLFHASTTNFQVIESTFLKANIWNFEFDLISSFYSIGKSSLRCCFQFYIPSYEFDVWNLFPACTDSDWAGNLQFTIPSFYYSSGKYGNIFIFHSVRIFRNNWILLFRVFDFIFE